MFLIIKYKYLSPRHQTFTVLSWGLWLELYIKSKQKIVFIKYAEKIKLLDYIIYFLRNDLSNICLAVGMMVYAFISRKYN